ncbi:MAG: hypothetical protein ACR2J3_12775 [Aridibacter sp.]
MHFYGKILILILTACFISACGDSDAAMPKDTLTAYTIAVRKKDVAMMKNLLSAASLKIHEQEAKAQNVSLDEIILRDTFFPVPEGKKFFDFKNQKIEGEKATVEVENNFGGYDVIFLVKEDGIWKIDKKGTSDQIIDQNEADQKKLDDLINQGRDQTNQDTNQLDGNLNTNQDLNQNNQIDNLNKQVPLPNDPNIPNNDLNDPNAQP